MAKIGIVALGGLDEKSKDFYLLEINSKIFILEAGIHVPLANNFGVQHFVPKLDYLNENRDKVKGVFLSTAVSHNILSIIELNKIIPNIKIYGSKTTLNFLKLLLPDENLNLNPLVGGEKINLSEQNIIPFEISSSLPESFGYIFETDDGNVVYMVNYIFDNIDEYRGDIKNSIQTLLKSKNYIFISGSKNFSKSDSISPGYRISNYLENANLTDKKTLFLFVYEEDYINIVEAINFADKNKIEIVFYSRIMYDLTIDLMTRGLLPKSHYVKYYDEEMDIKNKIVVVSGNKIDLFRKIIKILVDDVFKFDWLNSIFLISSVAQIGNEHIYQDILNKISLKKSEIIEIPKGTKYLFGPTLFDIRNLIDIINPKFFIPVKGLYKDLKSGADEVKKVKPEVRSIISFNGEYNVFSNGEYTGNSFKIKSIGNKIIDINNDQEINSEIINVRQSLNKDGFIFYNLITHKNITYILYNIRE